MDWFFSQAVSITDAAAVVPPVFPVSADALSAAVAGFGLAAASTPAACTPVDVTEAVQHDESP